MLRLGRCGTRRQPPPASPRRSHEPHFCILRESGTLEAALEGAREAGDEGALDLWSPVSGWTGCERARYGVVHAGGATCWRPLVFPFFPECSASVPNHPPPLPPVPPPLPDLCRWASSRWSCSACPPCETSCAASLQTTAARGRGSRALWIQQPHQLQEQKGPGRRQGGCAGRRAAGPGAAPAVQVALRGWRMASRSLRPKGMRRTRSQGE